MTEERTANGGEYEKKGVLSLHEKGRETNRKEHHQQLSEGKAVHKLTQKILKRDLDPKRRNNLRLAEERASLSMRS